MKLSMNLLLLKMQDFSYNYVGSRREKLQFEEVMIYIPGIELKSDALYVARASQVTGLFFRPGISAAFLLQNDAGLDTDTLAGNNIDLVLFQESVPEIFNQVQKVFLSFLRLEQRIFASTLRKDPPQTICDLIYPYLACHMIFYTPLFDVWAHTSGIELTFPEYANSINNGYCDFTTVLSDYLPELHAAQAKHTVHSVTPTYAPNRRVFIYAFRHDTELLGYGFVFCEDDALKTEYGYMDTVRTVFQMAEVYFGTYANAVNVSSETNFAVLLQTVLNQTGLPEAHLKNQLESIEGLFMNGHYQLAVFSLYGTFGTDNLLFNEIQKLFPLLKSAVYNGQLVMLLDHSVLLKGLYTPDELHKILEPVLKKRPYSIGISHKFESLAYLSEAYDQAQAAVRAGRRWGTGSVFFYADYSLRLLLNELDTNQLRALQSDEYRSVVAYDLANKTNYMRILQAYIHCNCNATATGKQLFLHRNTVLNTINRLEELFGFCMERMETRQELWFSDLVEQCIVSKN